MSIHEMLTATSLWASGRFCGSTWVSTHGTQGESPGCLPADRADLGRRVDVEVFGEWIGAEVVKDPVYDPTGARIRS